MSLKAFHVVFIAASLVLAFGFGGWGVHDWSVRGDGTNLALGIGSFVFGLLLIPYSIWFLRKTRKTGYL
jgi:hypothetical protein